MLQYIDCLNVYGFTPPVVLVGREKMYVFLLVNNKYYDLSIRGSATQCFP